MLEVHREEKEKIEAAKKNNEFFIKDLERQLDRSKSKRENAVKQFGTLIIAISTAGIGYVTAYIKDYKEDVALARWSQAVFVSCLFINLLSHMISLWVNSRVEKFAEDDLNAARYKHYPEEIKDENEFEELQEKRYNRNIWLDNTIRILNTISFLALICAVILFLLFVRNE